MKNEYNQDAFNYLAANLVDYTRLSKYEIAVFTAGYVSYEALEVESSLRRLASFKAVSRKYNERLGKTVTVYRHE